MALAIIADSDDEGDDNDLSTMPITRRGDILQLAGQQTGYSDSVISLPTSSTDPVYFQSIYKEQISAARLQQLQTMTPEQEATQQTWEATDPVSLPSQYVNLHAAAGGGNRLPEAVQPEAAGDPWAVPSSPEKRAQNSVSKNMRSKESKTIRSIQPLEVGVSNGFGAGAEDDSTLRARKRRRLDQTQDENTDSAERQALDQELQHEAAERLDGSSLPPTMPMQSGPGLIVTTQPLSNSQKMEYQSLEALSSQHNEEQSLTMALGTPVSKTKAKSTNEAKTPAKERTTQQKKRKRGDLSAEIGVLEDPVEETTEQSGYDDAGIPDAQRESLPDSEDEAYQDGLAAGATQVEEEHVKTSIEPKKRGRPKKAAKPTAAEEEAKAASEVEAAQPTDAVSTNAETHGETSKRKRGRPRKQKAAEVVDPVKANQETETVAAEEDKEPGHDGGPAADEMPVEPEAQSVPADDKGPRNKKSPFDSENPPPTENKAASNTAKRKEVASSKVVAAAGGKPPLYRVGLSRRSRIAPLLKIVRK